jgi:hypothetical protein
MTQGTAWGAASRRRMLAGSFAFGSLNLLPACGSGGGSGASVSAPAPAPATTTVSNPQPLPSGPVTPATVSVATSASGAIGPGFAGLS